MSIFSTLPFDIRKEYLPYFFDPLTFISYCAISREYWKLRNQLSYWKYFIFRDYQLDIGISPPAFPKYGEYLWRALSIPKGPHNWGKEEITDYLPTLSILYPLFPAPPSKLQEI